MTECLDDPGDSFSDPRDAEAIRSGEVLWFDARVRVIHKDTGLELGADYLGCCAYRDPAELFRGHATLVRDLRRLRGRTDRTSQRERKALKAMLANNIQLSPPVQYCCYGPGMVAEAVRMARKTLAGLGATASAA